MAALSAIAPLSGCPECLAPLEVQYDLAAIQKQTAITRRSIEAGPHNIWRYAALLPIPKGFEPDIPVGFTPPAACTQPWPEGGDGQPLHQE